METSLDTKRPRKFWPANVWKKEPVQTKEKLVVYLRGKEKIHAK